MAIALNAAITPLTNIATTTGTTIAVTVSTGGIAAGTLLVLEYCGSALSTNVTSVSDTANGTTGWTNIDVTSDTQTPSSSVWVSVLPIALASGNTITCTHATNTNRSVVVTAFTGAMSPATIDGTGTASARFITTGQTSGNMTISNADSLLIGIAAIRNNAETITAQPANWTALQSAFTTGGSAGGNAYVGGGYRLPAATGAFAYNPTYSVASSGGMLGIQSVRAAAAVAATINRRTLLGVG